MKATRVNGLLCHFGSGRGDGGGGGGNGSGDSMAPADFQSSTHCEVIIVNINILLKFLIFYHIIQISTLLHFKVTIR